VRGGRREEGVIRLAGRLAGRRWLVDSKHESGVEGLSRRMRFIHRDKGTSSGAGASIFGSGGPGESLLGATIDAHSRVGDFRYLHLFM
jgi:hypothetical protein